MVFDADFEGRVELQKCYSVRITAGHPNKMQRPLSRRIVRVGFVDKIRGTTKCTINLAYIGLAYLGFGTYIAPYCNEIQPSVYYGRRFVILDEKAGCTYSSGLGEAGQWVEVEGCDGTCRHGQ